ncbi:hypothetical protein SBI67_04220 [Mycolicibacterium sp. 120266]|uniref:hypothetical protein n=1 Tax=Mycolicibacterium sp. 120266 TaxID=3090601 RepID=UPI00299EC4EF|nr:hypothetical protein [Mycolicibacterium sp. 120266]MDX1871316.1 hypothetical protein [Mycolicibacterium sp. 120266]
MSHDVDGPGTYPQRRDDRFGYPGRRADILLLIVDALDMRVPPFGMCHEPGSASFVIHITQVNALARGCPYVCGQAVRLANDFSVK